MAATCTAGATLLSPAAWTAVLGWLEDPRDVARAARVCRTLWSCARSNRLWRTLSLRRWPAAARAMEVDLDLRPFNWKTFYVGRHLDRRRRAQLLPALLPGPGPVSSLRATCSRCRSVRACLPPAACRPHRSSHAGP